MRVLVCGAKVPFVRGGAEVLTESLAAELAARGFETDVVTIPFNWLDRLHILRSGLAWRLTDVVELPAAMKADLVIATRFPSYLIRHPRKVVWLVHQLRQIYDLYGTRYSDFGDDPRDQRVIEMLRAMDRRTLGEASARFAISRNTADRLRRFNGLEAEVLYPPPKLGAAYREGEFGDYVFTAGRLEKMKRFDLLVRALPHTRTPVRCRIAGTGPELGALRELASSLGVGERVDFLGWVEDRDLPELYAQSLAVFYAPYDEDYGYVTVEAFKSGKPVLTAADSGGVLEFVEDGVNGWVCAADAPRDVAARLDEAFADRERARALGRAGRERVRDIGWDEVISSLTGEPG